MMNKKTLIQIAIVLVRISQSLCVLALGFMVYDVIAHLLNPDHSLVRWEWFIEDHMPLSSPGDRLPLQTEFSYFFNWFQIAAYLFVLLWIWQVVIKILHSVASFKTFLESNVNSFLLIRNLVLFLFTLNLVHLFQEREAVKMLFQSSFELSYILFALAAHILAYVFKEGLRLANEQKMIV